MSPTIVNGRALPFLQGLRSVPSKGGAGGVRQPGDFSVSIGSLSDLSMASEPTDAFCLSRPPLAPSNSEHQFRGRRPDGTGAAVRRQFGTARFFQSSALALTQESSKSDSQRDHFLIDKAALDQIKRGGQISKIGLGILESPRFQSPGRCHVNALQNVHRHAADQMVSQDLSLIERLTQRSHLTPGIEGAALCQLAALLELGVHFKASITGRPPQGFENAEGERKIDTPEAMAALLASRWVVVVQGSGRAVTAPDSDLRKPIASQYAIEVNQPVVRESDGSVNSHHSITVIAVSTQSNPVPSLLPTQCLVFDQDPNRECIRQALSQSRWRQIPPHELTTDQIKEAGVDHLMTRVVSFDDLSQTIGTGGVGLLPVGGLIGGRFFVPSWAP